MNDMTMMSVQCNIILNNGYMCGLPPIGRCATCQRAFCLTHQAREQNYFGTVPYVDMCAPCFAVKKAEEDKRWEAENAPYLYFDKGAARTALLNSRVPSVAIYRVIRQREWKRKGILRRYSSEQVEVSTPVGRGWIIGECNWEYNDGGPYEGRNIVGIWQTALLDISPDDPGWHNSPYYGSSGLVRVQPYSAGYEILGGNIVANFWTQAGWIEAAQAIKRLAGESS